MTLYRIFMALLAPLLLIRARIRGEAWTDLAERMGRGPGGPAGLWLHGASLGELASVRWVVEALLVARPALTLIITANTVTGRQLVRDWRLPGVTARLAPLDTGPALNRFLNRWQPGALISLEAEFWPLRFALCGARSVPVLLLGARMSGRSFRAWQKHPRLAAALLAQVSLASAQDTRSRDHLAALGLPGAVTLPDLDLKAQTAAHLPQPATPPRADRAGWLLAASTHDGEEALILRAFANQTRFDRLILAPRHPDRAPAILALLRGQNLGFDQRSRGAQPGGAAILLADTLGEMDLWYATCGAVVIGGSFADKGGHTPWEPVRFATAMLHGPSTSNFAAAFAALDAAGGAVAVTHDSLAATLNGLDGAAQDRLASSAQAVLCAKGDVAAVLAGILRVSRL